MTEQSADFVPRRMQACAVLTDTRREYLAEIFRLEQPQSAPVIISALAERLQVSPPAVVKMVQRLEREGFLEREPYRGVNLTAEGRQVALGAIRRHRLIETFLVTVMGFSWDEVHEMVHALEGAINTAFEDRADELSGYPARCPHGDPIPTRDGHMPEMNDKSLLDFPVGTRGDLSRIRNHTPERLRYLGELGLRPGVALEIKGRAPLRGPVRLHALGQEHVVGADLAEDLFIENIVV